MTVSRCTRTTSGFFDDLARDVAVVDALELEPLVAARCVREAEQCAVGILYEREFFAGEQACEPLRQGTAVENALQFAGGNPVPLEDDGQIVAGANPFDVARSSGH